MDNLRIFKLGGEADHVTRYTWKVFKVKGQGNKL